MDIRRLSDQELRRLLNDGIYILRGKETSSYVIKKTSQQLAEYFYSMYEALEFLSSHILSDNPEEVLHNASFLKSEMGGVNLQRLEGIKEHYLCTSDVFALIQSRKNHNKHFVLMAERTLFFRRDALASKNKR
jgi:hypothetical protein